MTPLLEFEEVALLRGGRLLFEGVSFSIGPGEALHVSGPNGSGKSSLIRLAAGLLSPTSGRVSPARLALADETLALDRELPLSRALAFWGGDVGRGMEALGLARLGAVPVRLLSVGQGKRAALARVVASGVPLWLLDEPLNGLDEEGAGRLAAAVRAQLAAGGAVVAASHQPLTGDWRALRLGG